MFMKKKSWAVIFDGKALALQHLSKEKKKKNININQATFLMIYDFFYTKNSVTCIINMLYQHIFIKNGVRFVFECILKSKHKIIFFVQTPKSIDGIKNVKFAFEVYVFKVKPYIINKKTQHYAYMVKSSE